MSRMWASVKVDTAAEDVKADVFSVLDVDREMVLWSLGPYHT